jgi:hypothetical protein
MRAAALVARIFLAGAIPVLAAPPEAAISNKQINARLYLPDANNGYYRGTRFDWSGVIYSLNYRGHDYYGPWYTKRRDNVRDFIYKGSDIVAGPCSAITGPVEEYSPLGYDTAPAGGSFVKIGIGVLKKPDTAAYDHYRLYNVIDAGHWTIDTAPDKATFIQEIKGGPDGYAYVYEKTVRLIKGKPQLVLEHRLRNTGTRAIKTDVYNHNFLVLDHLPPGPGYSITFPFDVHSDRPPNSELAEIKGSQIVYLKTLTGKDTVATPIQGFKDTANDYAFHIDSTQAGAGMQAKGDRPMSRAALWSIRSVVAVEPYIDLSIEPGKEAAWIFTYDYYVKGERK